MKYKLYLLIFLKYTTKQNVFFLNKKKYIFLKLKTQPVRSSLLLSSLVLITNCEVVFENYKIYKDKISIKNNLINVFCKKKLKFF